jgi:hypothetical protein
LLSFGLGLDNDYKSKIMLNSLTLKKTYYEKSTCNNHLIDIYIFTTIGTKKERCIIPEKREHNLWKADRDHRKSVQDPGI